MEQAKLVLACGKKQESKAAKRLVGFYVCLGNPVWDHKRSE
jgi:hypothetical protein